MIPVEQQEDYGCLRACVASILELRYEDVPDDALSGVVYRDDAQIVTEILQKSYTSEQARCQVRVVTVHTVEERQEEAAA